MEANLRQDGHDMPLEGDAGNSSSNVSTVTPCPANATAEWSILYTSGIKPPRSIFLIGSDLSENTRNRADMDYIWFGFKNKIPAAARPGARFVHALNLVTTMRHDDSLKFSKWGRRPARSHALMISAALLHVLI